MEIIQDPEFEANIKEKRDALKNLMRRERVKRMMGPSQQGMIQHFSYRVRQSSQIRSK